MDKHGFMGELLPCCVLNYSRTVSSQMLHTHDTHIRPTCAVPSAQYSSKLHVNHIIRTVHEMDWNLTNISKCAVAITYCRRNVFVDAIRSGYARVAVYNRQRGSVPGLRTHVTRGRQQRNCAIVSGGQKRRGWRQSIARRTTLDHARRVIHAASPVVTR